MMLIGLRVMIIGRVLGLFVCLSDSLGSWHSNKQNIISRSSMESEYGVVTTRATKLLWLWVPPIIFCDKLSAMFVHNLIFHACTKHIEIDFHCTNDLIKKHLLDVQHVGALDQLANSLTKPLPLSQYLNHRPKLLLLPAPSASGDVRMYDTYHVDTCKRYYHLCNWFFYKVSLELYYSTTKVYGLIM